MERGAGSEQGSPESEMGDGDNDSVGYGAEMEVDAGSGSAGAASASASAYAARAGAYDGVDPFEGMEFDDEEDAWTFYNVYAHRVGFSTRISVMHRSRRDGSVMSRQFVCAKEGFRTYRGKNEVARADAGTGDEDSGRGRRTRAVTRVGCKAMIRVKKQDNGRWTVTKLETAHNHPLVPANQSHCLRPHKPLSECGKQRPFGGHRNGGTPLAIEPPPTPLTPPEPKDEQKNSAEDGVHSPSWRYNSLSREALRFAEEGASSLEVYIVAMQALQEAANRVNMAKRGIGQVAPLAVMPIAAQPPESFGQVHEISSGKQKKRRRSSNSSKENFTSNPLMYVQQPVNFLFVAPGSSSALPGPSHLVAAAPVSLSTQYGQTSGANHSVDNSAPPAYVAVDKFPGFAEQNASAPSSGNVEGGETKSTGAAAQIKESYELSQANGNSGCSVNALNSNAAPQLVTIPIGLCPSMDGSKISPAGMNSLNPGDVSSNGKVSFGRHPAQSSEQQPTTHAQTKTPDDIDSRGNPEGSSIRAAAIAAGARIASPSDAASIIKAAQSKGAIHIKPGENLPNYLKPLTPKPLTSLPPVNTPNLEHASPGHMQSGKLRFGDSAAAKDAIFGSTDGSDDEYDDDNTDDDDDEDEGLTGDDAEHE
ncbi:hypothetical protein EJB05_05343, partial [Eragrostis curvula]